MLKHKFGGGSNLTALSNLGIFASALLITASAVYFYSPVIKTHANTSDSKQTEVELNVGSSIAIRTDTENLRLNADVNEFVQGTVNVDVATNSQYGYTLTLEDVDSDTNMNHINSSITDVVSSNFSGTKTSSTMSNNNWGYSLDSTNFKKIPVNGSADTINTSSGPSPSDPGYDRTPVDFGIKVGMTLPSGTYRDVVRFSAYVNGSDGNPILPVSDACAGANYVSGGVLTDPRDGNTYTVKELLDGKCWMTQNLRISNVTISSADSDLPSGMTYTIPASISAFTYEYTPSNRSEVHIDSTYGGYYTFGAATAGWKDNEIDDSYGGVGNATSSICPKGWHLPANFKNYVFEADMGNMLIDGEEGEYPILASMYPTFAAITDPNGPNFSSHDFFEYSGEIWTDDHNGFWTSSSESWDYAWRFGYNSYYVGSSSEMKILPGHVRCVAN